MNFGSNDDVNYDQINYSGIVKGEVVKKPRKKGKEGRSRSRSRSTKTGRHGAVWGKKAKSK